MTTRNQYVQTMQSKLALWEIEFEMLKKRTQQVADSTKDVITNKVDELSAKSKKAKENLRAAASASDDAWGQIKEDLDSLWNDLEQQAGEVKNAVTSES